MLGKSDEFVTKNRFAAIDREQFADDAHRRENHNVNSGVRIEPEEMLETSTGSPPYLGSKIPI